jgi:hypothetical protein
MKLLSRDRSTLIKIVVACCQPSARRAEVAFHGAEGHGPAGLKFIFKKVFCRFDLSGQANRSFNSAWALRSSGA